jgi:hypothetical protein
VKTRDDVERLKMDWIKDTIFDLEEVEGFEDHAEELLAFRKAERRAASDWRMGDG